MLPTDWIAYRRADDGELLGWMRPVGEEWIAVSLLGWEVSAPVDWLAAEEALESVGLSYLGEVWMLQRGDAEALRVRLVEVDPQRIVVQTDDYGAIDAPVQRYELAWPAPPELSPRR
jgi:hypothetical protein